LTTAEVRRLSRACGADPSAAHDRALFLVRFAGALRRSRVKRRNPTPASRSDYHRRPDRSGQGISTTAADIAFRDPIRITLAEFREIGGVRGVMPTQIDEEIAFSRWSRRALRGDAAVPESRPRAPLPCGTPS